MNSFVIMFPAIALFDGIVVRMRKHSEITTGGQQEHKFPHIHVNSAEHKASYDLKGNKLSGDFPKVKEKKLRDWLFIHEEDLLENWKLSEDGEELFRIY